MRRQAINTTVSTAPRQTVRPPERQHCGTIHVIKKDESTYASKAVPPAPRARDTIPAHLETMHYPPLPVLYLMTTANVPVPIVATHLYRWPIRGIVARDAADTLDVNGTTPVTPPPCFANSLAVSFRASTVGMEPLREQGEGETAPSNGRPCLRPALTAA